MIDALDQQSRTALEQFMQRSRRLLQEDLAREAEGRYGIHIEDGEIEAEDALHLDPTGLAARRDIVEILTFLRGEEGSKTSAVARLVREATFTHLNRLVAIRIAEEIDVLPESLRNGVVSAGFKELLEVAPLLAHDVAGGYWRYLRLCGDELAADLPQLFDPRNPLLELAPSTTAVDSLVEMICAPDLATVWAAPDAFGWTYQFFNSGDERRAMREASAAPRTSRELAVRNQFFTPRYVVDFLVQNSLGRRLLEADPKSGLAQRLPMLIGPPTESGDALALNDVRILDPACGSGHFLLGAYDLLEQAWKIEGVSPEEAAPQIVSALWGIDIDPRCAQVAAAAVILRARRHCKSLELPTPNIVTARALPEPSEGWDSFLSTLSSNLRQLVVSVRDSLVEAPILGPLLKSEELLASDIRSLVIGADNDPSTLFGEAGIASDAFGRAEADVIAVLKGIADDAGSSPAQRLFAAEAEDALRFVNAMRQRYDIILMNPPFGAAPDDAEGYLEAAYPETWTELYAAFFDRAIELLEPSGYVGALTSSQYFSTRRLAGFRERLLDRHRPLVLLDLGGGVLQGATVNTAIAVLPKARTVGPTAYLDLTAMSTNARTSTIEDLGDVIVWRDLGAFSSIPNCPFALHMPDSIVSMWRGTDRLEPQLGIVRTGCKSFDDFRFVRAWWEIPPDLISEGWRRYSKGGEYCPYVSYSHLLIDWRNDGEELRRYGKDNGRLAQVLQSSTHWGRAGLCYPRMSSIGFAVRALPAGEIFADQSIAILPQADSPPNVLMGLLNSTPVADLLQLFGRGRATENGAVKSLPFGRAFLDDIAQLEPAVAELVAMTNAEEAGSETACTFRAPGFLGVPKDSASQSIRSRISAAAALQQRVDTIVGAALGGISRLDPTLVDRPTLVGRAFGPADGAETTWADDLLSYSVGCAFGRWDIRMALQETARDPRTDVFRELPLNPPGLLCGPDGQHPVQELTGYPLTIPSAYVLVDEQGHQWDIEDSILRAAEVISECHGNWISDALQEYGAISLRQYLRRFFFKSHLKRYSKSRRKAPIYWPLTVPSGRWGVWIYALALSRETLYAVASEALRREAHAEAEIARLEHERAAAAGGRRPRDLEKALDDERKLAEELRSFRQEAERIAGLGWKPDLNDGLLLCAAPLADLFPLWDESKKCREEVRAGKHAWAAVAGWREQL